MKLHINTTHKTVAIEGTCKVSTVLNYLISWFPEDYEEWSFIEFQPTISYKEVIVERDVYRNPYWNPFRPYYYNNAGIDSGEAIVNPTYISSGTTSSLSVSFKDMESQLINL